MATRSPLLLQATTVEAVRGEGCWLVDADGRHFLDFTAGIGVTSTRRASSSTGRSPR